MISKIIYWLSKLLFYVSMTFVVFVLVGSILSYFEFNYKVDMPFVSINTYGTEAKIKIPFTGMYVGFQYSFTVVLMWFSLLFYAYYFFTLSQFFKVFTIQQVFTEASLKILRWFFKLNFIPLGVILIYTLLEIFKENGFKIDSEYLLVVLHLFVALLVYLYMELLKKGKIVQDENNLTI